MAILHQDIRQVVRRLLQWAMGTDRHRQGMVLRHQWVMATCRHHRQAQAMATAQSVPAAGQGGESAAAKREKEEEKETRNSVHTT